MKKTDNYRFKFSVIMSVYNTDRWIEEAVDSVIAQDIGFKENIQIVFVNDGSPDNSEELCLLYQEKYPNNITYKKKQNGGLSSARNYGLKYREGKYINFFDPDDILSKNVFSEVWNFFEENKETVESVGIPLEYFEARTGRHPRYELFGQLNRVIDLEEEPAHAILSSAATFYKSRVFDNRYYDTSMFGSEDVKLNIQLYEECPRVGYVCENGVMYRYRIRHSKDSIVSQLGFRPESFLTVAGLIENILEKPQVEPYKQEIMIYELRARLKNIRPEYFKSKEQYENIINTYKKGISKIDTKIINTSPFIKKIPQKYIFSSNVLSRKPEGINSKGKLIFANNAISNIRPNIFIKNMEIINDSVVVDVIYHNYQIKGLRPALLDADMKELPPTSTQQLESSYDVQYGIYHISNTGYCRYVVPFNRSGRYKFYLKDEKNIIIAKNPKIHPYLRFALNHGRIKVRQAGYRLRLFDNNLEIIRSNGSQVVDNLVMFFVIALRYKKIAWMRLLSKSNKRYVLLTDRPMIAKDNAEAVYKYIYDKDAELAKYTYFVISKSSPDFNRLKRIGNVVAKGSLRHKYLYLNAKLVVSSHLHPLFIFPYRKKEMVFYRDLLDSKFIWIQHGINMNGIENAANKFRELPYRTLVSSHHEISEFSKPKYFYGPEQLIKCGLPRFDCLRDESQKIISIMPTWRTYILGKTLETGTNETKDDFQQSDYFSAFKRLLSDARLLKFLQQTGYTINFILHPSATGYTKIFEALENDSVKIITTNSVDYTKIFNRSAVLVTDYSSVFFDFSYMYKPVIYYQFDRESFFSNHYKSGSFNYDEMGFGPVYKNKKDVVDAIIKTIRNDFTIEKKYRDRIDHAYLYDDRDNSKRVYEEVKGLLQ